MVGCLQQHALGDFQHEAARVDAVLRNELDAASPKIDVAELDRREVDRDFEFGPALGIASCAIEDPFAERGQKARRSRRWE